MSKKNIWLRRAPILIAGVVVIGVTVSLIAFVKSMMVAPPPSKKMVQQISLIQPPPPPKVEKPPEPEIKEEVKLEEPEPTPEEAPDPMADDAPMGDDLALDAEGVAGMDGFGLLAKKGGRDFIGVNGGGVYAWYASAVNSDVLDYLSEVNEVRKQRYAVDVWLWVDGNGAIHRFELKGSTGNHALDASLKTALAALDRLREKPPDGLPQPVRIRITSRL
jgi:protein TonB